MADQWAILASTAMIFLALGIIAFYLIPIQANLWYTNRDWLSGIRLRLLLASSFVVISASPIIINRILRSIGIESVILSNASALAFGVCFLGFAISLVSIYIYNNKE